MAILKGIHSTLERKKGEQFREEVNKRVANFPKCYGLHEAGKKIYEIKNNSQLKKPVLGLALFSGAQIDWWFQVSPIILRGLLTDQELKLWMDHVKLDQLLCQRKHDEHSLDELFSRIENFRRDFVEQLADRKFSHQDDSIEPDTCNKCANQMARGDKFCSKCGHKVQQVLDSILKSGRTPFYMKFECMLHWVR